VPLLMLWLATASGPRPPTSLAAISFIASVRRRRAGPVRQRERLDAVLVGVPAVAGVLVGTWLQQRLNASVISLLFAAILVASAGRAGDPVIGELAIGLGRAFHRGAARGSAEAVLFVRGSSLFAGLSQHQAEATSLLAIVPVAIIGTYRQDRYATSTAPTRWWSTAVGGRARRGRGAANALREGVQTRCVLMVSSPPAGPARAARGSPGRPEHAGQG